MFYFQYMLIKLVNLHHIDIGKICDVDERYPFTKKRELIYSLSKTV